MFGKRKQYVCSRQFVKQTQRKLFRFVKTAHHMRVNTTQNAREEFSEAILNGSKYLSHAVNPKSPIIRSILPKPRLPHPHEQNTKLNGFRRSEAIDITDF